MTFNESVKSQIEVLAAGEAHILSTIAPLQKELEEIRARMNHLEGYLAALDSGEAQKGLKEKEPITDKIVRVFEREKRPLHYLEVLSLLREQEGFVMTGKDPKANMTAKLAGSARFSRLDRGIYVLTEWTKQNQRKAPQED